MRFVLDPTSPTGVSFERPQKTVQSTNGYVGTRKLRELEEVQISGTPSDNQALAYDSASGKWIPQTISGGGGGGAVDSVNGQTGDVNLDGTYVNTTGDTMTGDLIIDGSASSHELYLKSSQAGGVGYSGNDLDTTSRLSLESYQTNGPSGTGNDGFMGEVLRIYLKDARAKAMMSYYAVRTSLNTRNSAYWGKDRAIAWLGAHELAQDQPDPQNLDYHNHWSVETPDADDQLRTRFSVDFSDKNPGSDGKIGSEYTTIYTNNATTVIYAENNQVLRIQGGGSHNRDIEWNEKRYADPTTKRWILRVDTDNNWRLIRRQSATNTFPTVMIANRTNGNIAFNQETTDSAAKVAMTFPGAATHGLLLQAEASPSSGYAYLKIITPTASTDRIIDSRVATDTIARFTVNGAGRMEFGPGTASTDVYLYRNATNELRTESNFIARTLSIGANTTSANGTPGFFERSTDGNILLLRNTAASNNSANIVLHTQTATSRVLQAGLQSDTIQRISIEASGKIELGSGSATRDTNLYRSSADTLATDDDFEITSATKGVILKSPNGTRFRLTVGDDGALTTTAV